MYGEDNQLILRFGVVETLKKMNRSYPKNQECYDDQFIRRVMKSIFKKEDLLHCAKSHCLRDLDFFKRSFLKGKLCLLN